MAVDISGVRAAYESFEPPIGDIPAHQFHTDSGPKLWDSGLMLVPGQGGGYVTRFQGSWVWMICGRMFASTFALDATDSPEQVHNRMAMAYKDLVSYVGKSLDRVQKWQDSVRVGPAIINDGDVLPRPSEVS